MGKNKFHIHQKEDAFSFTPATLEPEIINYLDFLRTRGERNDWIKKAIQFRFQHDNYKKGFLIQMIQENYTACKHFLRMIGASMKLTQERNDKFMSI